MVATKNCFHIDWDHVNSYVDSSIQRRLRYFYAEISMQVDIIRTYKSQET